MNSRCTRETYGKVTTNAYRGRIQEFRTRRYTYRPLLSSTCKEHEFYVNRNRERAVQDMYYVDKHVPVLAIQYAKGRGEREHATQRMGSRGPHWAKIHLRWLPHHYQFINNSLFGIQYHQSSANFLEIHPKPTAWLVINVFVLLVITCRHPI